MIELKQKNHAMCHGDCFKVLTEVLKVTGSIIGPQSREISHLVMTFKGILKVFFF